MDKVIIIESEEHYEVVNAFIYSFQKYSDIHIQVHCNPNVRDNITNINTNAITWYKTDDKIISEKQFKREIIIITSPIKKERNLPDTIPIYYVVHNVHMTFSPFKYINLVNPKALLSFMRYKVNYSATQKLLLRCKGFIFISDKTENYFIQHYKQQYPGQKSIAFPTYWPFSEKHHRAKKKKSVIIPGSFHPTRRNFKPIIDALHNHTFNEIQFIFLGKMDHKMAQKIEVASNNNAVKVHTKELSMADYYNQLRTGDLLILPLKRIKYFGGVTEKFGVSTFSAIWMDAFSTGIPALIPDYLKIDDRFKSYFNFYHDSNSLTKAIHSYFKTDYEALKKSFKRESDQYFNPIIKIAITKLLND